MLDSSLKDALLHTKLGEYLTHPEEIEMLLKYNKFVTFSPGQIIMQQGKTSEGMYVILFGTALVTAKILGEGGTYIATLSRGNLLGEISLIEKGLCATSVIASSHVKCLLILDEYFEMLGKFFPETKFKITKAITQEVCGRINDMDKKIVDILVHSKMATRSMFAEVIKSLAATSVTTLEEVGLNREILHKRKFFALLSQQEFDELLNHTSLIKAPKNCTIIHEGEKDSSCYIILRGAVLASIVKSNKAAKLAALGPDNFFNSVTAADNRFKAIINYTTCEPAILMKLSPNDLTFFKNNNDKLWYKIFDYICQCIVSLEKLADKLDVRLKSELYNR